MHARARLESALCRWLHDVALDPFRCDVSEQDAARALVDVPPAVQRVLEIGHGSLHVHHAIERAVPQLPVRVPVTNLPTLSVP